MTQAIVINDQEAQDLIHTVTDLIKQAKTKGVTDIEVAASINRGYGVEVRLNEVDKLEYTNDKGLALTVYFGHRKGSASSSDFSSSALQTALEKACNIAHYTHEDPCVGMIEPEYLAHDYPNCDLYHTWDLSPQQAIEMAKECEQAGMASDSKITNSEGVSIDTTQGFKVFANSKDFVGSYYASQHQICAILLASENHLMERDYEFSVACDPSQLNSPMDIALKAAAKAVARLNPRRVSTGKYPILFKADVARGILGHLMSAIQGGRLYRQASFLQDSLGQQLLPIALTLEEKPHELKAIGSAPFDTEGAAVRRRELISNGILQTYCLDSYAARKLKMTPTGHSGGIHNVDCLCEQTYDLTEIFKTMQNGLLVTELMGQGVNLVTGDYSREASGFWIENGEIAYPVSGVTIAGNLREMLQQIIAVGNDVDKRGNIRTGSLLIESMILAGA